VDRVRSRPWISRPAVSPGGSNARIGRGSHR
jgi:hypothetical protein